MFFIIVSEYKKPAGPIPAGSNIVKSVLFAPLVEPVEILTMPEQRVLRLGNPVALIREDDKLRRNTHHLSCIESSHSLVIRNTEVHAAVDAEDRGPDFDSLKIPFFLRSDNQYIVKSADFSG